MSRLHGWADRCNGPMLAVLLLLFASFAVGHARADADPPRPEEDLILEVTLGKNQVYPGESVDVTVTFLVGRASVRNIQYPTLKDDKNRSIRFTSSRTGSVIRDDQEYSSHEFSGRFTPLDSGAISLGPAELVCDVLMPSRQFAGPFALPEPKTMTIRSAPTTLLVQALPSVGRPAGFSGAIGSFRIVRRATPTRTEPGDAVTVTTSIAGTGNLEAFSCPAIELPGVRAYPPRSRRASGSLVCEQVILLMATGNQELPGVSIHFFDPVSGRYRQARSEALRIEVRNVQPSTAVLPSQSEKQSVRTQDKRFSPWLWVGGLAGILALAVWLFTLRRAGSMRPRSDPAPLPQPARTEAEWLDEARRAHAAGDGAGFHTAAYRFLQVHLGARHNLVRGSVSGEVVERVLRPAGVNEEMLQSYEKLFALCEMARYGPTQGNTGCPPDGLCLLERMARD